MGNEKFYYVRAGKTDDTKGVPIATVCLTETEDGWARGVAICSPEDNASKRVGRAIAKGRALLAKETGETRQAALRGILKQPPAVQPELQAILGDDFLLAAPNANLTAFEEEITTERIAETQAGS